MEGDAMKDFGLFIGAAVLCVAMMPVCLVVMLACSFLCIAAAFVPPLRKLVKIKVANESI